jgi:hypothetical protein
MTPDERSVLLLEPLAWIVRFVFGLTWIDVANALPEARRQRYRIVRRDHD